MFCLDSDEGKKRGTEGGRKEGNDPLLRDQEIIILPTGIGVAETENLGDGFVKAIIKDHFHFPIFWMWGW